MTEGPFWVDAKLNRSDIRSDFDGTDTQLGVPPHAHLNLQDAGGSCAPQVGAFANTWHANAQGEYSAVSGSVQS